MFNVMKNFKWFAIVSVAIILIGLIFLGVNKGFQYDIDFLGGTMMQIDMEKQVPNSDVEECVKESTGSVPYSIQKVVGTNQVIIKLKSLESDARVKLFSDIKTKFNLTSTAPLKTDNVSPSISNEIKSKGGWAVIIALILILLYITVRFEFYSGVAGIIALVHDILMLVFVYAVFRIPFNSSAIAVILTIIGYSINNVIIVFDRIRENKKFAKKESFEEVCEKSIWQTMRRSINTSGTVVTTLVVLYIMGETSIKEFSIPLIVGVLSGTYAASFIAPAVWNAIRGKKA